ncbi:MAG TPA: flagellar hook-basal body complex protein FliE [Nitrospirales bacterium]|nr:flagellar hook-basal body complex protein FliE [Nitrospirales bacterium]
MDKIELSGIKPIATPDGAGALGRAATGGQGEFMSTLKDAIAKTNDVQLEANQAVEKLMTGETQNVHQTMIALQKADVSFQLMMQIRNKIVTAYEEIQRMQI